MNIEVVRSVLLWSTVINFSLLASWGVLFLFARDWMHRVGGWYRVSAEQMDVVQVAGMTFYKLIIFMFNLVPYIALQIVV